MMDGYIGELKVKPDMRYASVLVWREGGRVRSEANVPDDVSDMSAAILKMESEKAYVGDLVVTGYDRSPQVDGSSHAATAADPEWRRKANAALDQPLVDLSKDVLAMELHREVAPRPDNWLRKVHAMARGFGKMSAAALQTSAGYTRDLDIADPETVPDERLRVGDEREWSWGDPSPGPMVFPSFRCHDAAAEDRTACSECKDGWVDLFTSRVRCELCQ